MTAEPWTVEFERRAEKDLERLDPKVKQRVLSAIGQLAEDPGSADLRRLKGRAAGRHRTTVIQGRSLGLTRIGGAGPAITFDIPASRNLTDALATQRLSGGVVSASVDPRRGLRGGEGVARSPRGCRLLSWSRGA